MWRLSVALPTRFYWKDALGSDDSYFRIQVELSLQGLLRKFPVAISQTIGFLDFNTFVMNAFKEGIENEVFKRVTNENYEGLEFQELDKNQIRAKLHNFKDLRNDPNFPIQMQWSTTLSAVFNLISYPINYWLDILNTRNRNLYDRAYILKYQ